MLKKRARSQKLRNLILKQQETIKKQKNTEDGNDFKFLGINENIVEKLNKNSIVSLFEVQKKVYNPLYQGENIIAASLTGSGKTLSFVLPILQKAIDNKLFTKEKPFCLVMAPTRELAIQVGKEFSELSSASLMFKVTLIYGGVSIDDQVQELRNGTDIVVGTPGRIMDMIEREELFLDDIKTVVLDEADKMLSMGFQDQIEYIFNQIYKVNKEIQVCLFSATIDRSVEKISKNIMRNKNAKFIDLVKDLEGRTPKTVQHLAVNCIKSDKVTTIADLILCYGGKSKATIVFVDKKSECNDLMISDKIKQEVQIIHGDINQQQREATISGFKNGKFKCLIATDVASRGLDLPLVDLIIQSEPPKELDTYIHRAGRTARAGRSGTCITLYTKFTEGLISRIEQKIKVKFQKICPPQKKEIIECSVRDVEIAIKDVDSSMIKLFQNSAEKLIEEYGALDALARMYAYISGHTEKLKSRSLLCGAEGFITYKIQFKSTFNNAGYVWGFFKRLLPEDIKNKIRGLKVAKSLDACVFDFIEEGHKILEEYFNNDKSYSDLYIFKKAESLPQFLEEVNSNKFKKSIDENQLSVNGRLNNERNPGVRTSLGDRSKRLDLFIGNLPHNPDEMKLKQFINSNGIDTSDVEVRFVIDRVTNQPKGFGFISCYNQEKYDKILSLNGATFSQRIIKINADKTK